MKKFFIPIFLAVLFFGVFLGVISRAASLEIKTGSLPDGMVGKSYSEQLEAEGGTLPYSWSIKSGNLPNGLSLSDSGRIEGTPTGKEAWGEWEFSIRVVDNSSQIDSKDFSIFIGCDTPTFVTDSPLPSGTVGEYYNFNLEAEGGISPYNWVLLTSVVGGGPLPDGLNLSSGGTIEGTPTKSGHFRPAIRVEEGCSQVTGINGPFKIFGIDIESTPLEIITTSLPSGEVGEQYSAGLEARGGEMPYSWSIVLGPLPDGLNLSSGGTIEGTPTTEETSNFSVVVMDNEENEVVQPLFIQINPSSDSTETCSDLGGDCCPPGEVCTSGKISGTSNCLECCGNLANCETKTCSGLGGHWCQVGETCDGIDSTSQASDAGLHSGQICCDGDCKTGGKDNNGGLPGITVELENPLAADTITELIDRFINFIFYIGIVFAPIMFLIGGFYFMTAGGDPQKISKAKSIMIYTAIGLAVVLLAKGLIALIKDLLGVEEEEEEPSTYFKNICFFGTIGVKRIYAELSRSIKQFFTLQNFRNKGLISKIIKKMPKI